MKFLRFLSFLAGLFCVNFGVAYADDSEVTTPIPGQCENGMCSLCEQNVCSTICDSGWWGMPDGTCTKCSDNPGSDYVYSLHGTSYTFNKTSGTCYKYCEDTSCTDISNSSNSVWGPNGYGLDNITIAPFDTNANGQAIGFYAFAPDACNTGTIYCPIIMTCDGVAACKPTTKTVTFKDDDGTTTIGTLYVVRDNMWSSKNTQFGAITDVGQYSGVVFPIFNAPAASKQGYTFVGWYDAQTGGTRVIDADGKLTQANASIAQTTETTLYARYTQTTSTTKCECGEYIPAGGTECVECPAGFYCTEGIWPVPMGYDQGKIDCKKNCPGAATSDTGACSVEQCYEPCDKECYSPNGNCPGNDTSSCSYDTTLTVSGIKPLQSNGACGTVCKYTNMPPDSSTNWCPITSCPADYYFVSEDSACKDCESGYSAPAGSTAATQCTKSCSVPCDASLINCPANATCAPDLASNPGHGIVNQTQPANSCYDENTGTQIQPSACEFTITCNDGYAPIGDTCVKQYIVNLKCTQSANPTAIDTLYYGNVIEYTDAYLDEVCKNITSCGANQHRDGWEIYLGNPAVFNSLHQSPVQITAGVTYGDATPITLQPHCVADTNTVKYMCYTGDSTGKTDTPEIGQNYNVRPLSWYENCSIDTANFNGWLFSGDENPEIHVPGNSSTGTISNWNYGDDATFVPGYTAMFGCDTNYWQASNGGNPQNALVKLGDNLTMPTMNCEPKAAYEGWIDTTDTNWHSSYSATINTPVPGATCNAGTSLSQAGDTSFAWNCPTDLTFKPNDALITKNIRLSCGVGGASGTYEITYDTQNTVSAWVNDWLQENCQGSCSNPAGAAHGYWKFCGTWANGAVPNVTQISGESDCYIAESNYDIGQINWANVTTFSMTKISYCPHYVKYKCSVDATDVYDEPPYSYFEESYNVLSNTAVGCPDTGHAFTQWANAENSNETYNENENVASWPHDADVTLVAQWGDANTYSIFYNNTASAQWVYGGNHPNVYTIENLPVTVDATMTRAHSIFMGWCPNSNLTNCGNPSYIIPVGTTGDVNLYAKWSCDEPYHLNPQTGMCEACNDNEYWNGQDCSSCAEGTNQAFPYSTQPFNWSIDQCWRNCENSVQCTNPSNNSIINGIDVCYARPFRSEGVAVQIEFYGNYRLNVNACDATSVPYCPYGLDCAAENVDMPRSVPVTFFSGNQELGKRHVVGLGRWYNGESHGTMSSGNMWAAIMGPAQQMSFTDHDQDDTYTFITYPADTAPNAELSGSTFNGYYDQQTGGTQYVSNTYSLNQSNANNVGVNMSNVILGNRELYAQYNQNSYTITYRPNYPDATGYEAQTVTYGSSFVTKNANTFTRPGYRITAWGDDTNTQSTNYPGLGAEYTYHTAANIDLYALWQICPAGTYSYNGTCEVCPDEYPLSNQGSDEATDCYQTCETQCTEPATCPVANATCTYGANPNPGRLYKGADICDALSLVCQYSFECNSGYTLNATNNGCVAKKYNVVYECGQEGTGGPITDTNQATYGETYNVLSIGDTNCSYTGHDFLGWKYIDETVHQPGNMTWYYTDESPKFTAQWGDANEYTVTYFCEAGASSSAQYTVTYGGTHTVLAVSDTNCSKPGYSFDGWKFSGDGNTYNSGDSIVWNYTDSHTLTAQWTKCSANYYSTGTICTPCNSGYSSTPGSTSAEACVKDCSIDCERPTCPSTVSNYGQCSYGNETASGIMNQVQQQCIGERPTCTITYVCDANYYLEDAECKPCPDHTTSPSGSIGFASCVAVICDPGQYLDGTECKDCNPEYPYSTQNATSPTQCYKECNTPCVNPDMCPVANASCTYDANSNPSQGILYNAAGAICSAQPNTCEVSAFVCADGYQQNATTCTPCPAGTYEVDNTCVPCPDGYVSNQAATTCTPCPAGTYEVDNTCEPCGTGYSSVPGSTSPDDCFLSECPAGQHIDHGACYDNIIDCDAPYAENATRTWNETLRAYGSCQIQECQDGYHIASNACVPDSGDCVVANGRGERSWNNGWSTCTNIECDPGFELNSNGTACLRCSNYMGADGQPAVSSYISGCEIATCMYQGQKYALNNGECEPICETETDNTGSKHWDNATKRCVRTCNPGYKMW